MNQRIGAIHMLRGFDGQSWGGRGAADDDGYSIQWMRRALLFSVSEDVPVVE